MSAAIATARVEKMLTGKLGATLSESGRDHRFFEIRLDGRMVARTKVSFSSRGGTLHDGLISAMAKQLSVSNGQFVNLVTCMMSGDEWVALIRAKYPDTAPAKP